MAIAPRQVLLLLHELFDQLVAAESIGGLKFARPFRLAFLHDSNGGVAARRCIADAGLGLGPCVRKADSTLRVVCHHQEIHIKI